MILLGITSDRRTIHVRTDDLSTRERKQVHECADLINKFRVWKERGFFVGLMTFLCIFLAVFIGILIAGAVGAEANDPAVLRAAKSGFIAAFILGSVAWFIAANIARDHTERGISTLYAHMGSSTRCDEFVREYVEDSTHLQRLLKRHPKPAQCSA